MVMVIIRTLESEEQYSHMTYSIACFTPLKWKYGLVFCMAGLVRPDLFAENTIKGNIYFDMLELFAFHKLQTLRARRKLQLFSNSMASHPI
jgi:hypothetical protein